MDTEDKKNYYLIDYENVNKSGFNGIELMTEKDCIVVFYTQNANTIPFDLHFKLAETKASLQLIYAATGGKNALDFQLSTYLGFLIGSHIAGDIHIISNDKGYEFLKSFWEKQSVIISIASDLKGNINIPQSAAPEKESDFDKAVKPLKMTFEDKNAMNKIFKHCLTLKTQNEKSQYINNNIGKLFGSDKQKKYYAAIKPLIK